MNLLAQIFQLEGIKYIEVSGTHRDALSRTPVRGNYIQIHKLVFNSEIDKQKFDDLQLRRPRDFEVDDGAVRVATEAEIKQAAEWC